MSISSSVGKRSLLHNGCIYPMEAKIDALYNGIMVEDENIKGLLKGKESSGVSSDIQRVDLKGKTVLPAFTDCHTHFLSYSLSLKRLKLYEITSLEEVLQKVHEEAEKLEPGEWIRGRGWEVGLWKPSAFPARWDLDRVTPRNPAVLTSKDGHTLWLNSLAIEVMGLDSDWKDVPGGRADRERETGRLTGIFRENACYEVVKRIPQLSEEDLLHHIRNGMRAAHQAGVVSVHNFETRKAFRIFQQLRNRRELNMRILHSFAVEELDAVIGAGIMSGFGDKLLKTGYIKLFADGALGVRSAWMLSPYVGEPENLGFPVTKRAELMSLVNRCHENGLAAAVHAIGDAANKAVLDVFEESGKKSASESVPFSDRIEHAQLLDRSDIRRFAETGVIASVQPVHAPADIYIADQFWGKERSRNAYPFRSLLDHNARLIFGSDAPIECLNPIKGIHAAVTRRREDGSPSEEGWNPQEKITAYEAVLNYTVNPAEAVQEDHYRGTLIPGKKADLIVLSDDPFQIEPHDLRNIKVLGTMLNGKWVYRDFDF